MKHYLQTLDYGLWLAIICLQWLLLAGCLARTLQRTVPRFVCAILFLCLESSALLAISSFLSYPVYFWSYYAGIAIETILLLAVLYEIFRNTFDPLGALPPGTLAKMGTWLAAAAVVAITVALWKPAIVPDPATSLLRTAHRTTVLIVALALWTLVMYARFLAIPWTSRVAGIASGYLLWLTTESVTRAGQSFASRGWFAWCDRLLMLATIAAIVMWMRAARRPEEIATELPTPEVLRKASAAIAEMRSAVGAIKVVGKKQWSEE